MSGPERFELAKQASRSQLPAPPHPAEVTDGRRQGDLRTIAYDSRRPDHRLRRSSSLQDVFPGSSSHSGSITHHYNTGSLMEEQASVPKYKRLVTKKFQKISVNAAALAAGSAVTTSLRRNYGVRDTDSAMSSEDSAGLVDSAPSEPTRYSLASKNGAIGHKEHPGDNPRTSPPSSFSFRTLALQAVEKRNRSDKFHKTITYVLTAIQGSLLVLFVLFLICATTFNTMLYGSAASFYSLFAALGIYIVTIFPIWLAMLSLLLSGRFRRRFSDIVRIHRLFGRVGPSGNTLHRHPQNDSVVVSFTPFRQEVKERPLEQATNASVPPSSRKDLNEARKRTRRFPEQKQEPKPGLLLFNKSRAATDNIFAMGNRPRMSSATPQSNVCKNLKNDSSLLLYYWNAQKDRMRRGQLQADYVQRDMGFDIPSVMTSGELFSPSSYVRFNSTATLQSRYPKYRIHGPVVSDHGVLNPRESCPDLSESAVKQLYSRRSTMNFSTEDLFARMYPSQTEGFQPSATTAASSEKNGKTKSQEKRRVFSQKRCSHNRCCGIHLCGGDTRSETQARAAGIFGLAVAVYEFPPFQVSMVIRNFVWCGLYIWGTTVIHRESSHDLWIVDDVPKSFRFLNAVFMWMITWDYIVSLLAASDQWRFVFSFPSIVDLLTMPPTKVFAAVISETTAEQYPIYIGSLRFLRLVRIEGTLMHVVPWITVVKLRIISLGIGASVITLMFASLMFAFEAPYELRQGFTTLYDFIFFALVTVSTVGYGDFSPTKIESKAIVMFAIVVTLACLPTEIQKLITALQTPPTSIGRIPHEHQDYIAIAGPIEPRQLTIICRELANSIPGSCTDILVVTPGPVGIYGDVIRTSFTRARINVAAVQASSAPSATRSYFAHARAVFIVGTFSPRVEDPMHQILYQDPEANQLDDDQSTLMRFIGAQQVCWPDRPICIQLNDGMTKHLVTEMGAYHHTKMQLLAKSCAGCPGFSTLITNLFYQPLEDVEILLQDELVMEADVAMNTKLYFRGSRYQIYRLEFPDCFYGLHYTLLTRILASQYGAYLIGVSCVSKEYWLNPVGYRIGDELEYFTDWPFAGIILAPSLSVVQAIYIPEEQLALETRYIRRKARDRNSLLNALYGFTQKQSRARERFMSSDLTFLLPTADRSTELPATTSDSTAAATPASPLSDGAVASRVQGLKRTSIGIIEVPNAEIARRHVFTHPNSDLIVACGWPRGLHVFFTAVLSSQKCNIIILAPSYPSGLSMDALLPFAGVCAWVRGSALDVADLVRAGVLHAKSCCVFSCLHVPWCQDASKQRTDTQAILVREFIYALHHSDTMIERRMKHLIEAEVKKAQQLRDAYDRAMSPLPTTIPSPPSDKTKEHDWTRQEALKGHVVTPSPPAGEQLRDTNHTTPLVVIDMRSESGVEFLDVTPVRASGTFFTKSEIDSLWSQHGLCMSNPEYTSGRVLLEEMLYGMICFSLPISRFCTDSHVIDHLVNGAHIPLPEGFQPTCPIWMQPLPSAYEGLAFGVFMDELLKEALKLAIGVYSQTRKLSPKKTPLDLLQGEDAFHYVVISCPPLDMLLQKGDRVYVIDACPAEALGLLLSEVPPS